MAADMQHELCPGGHAVAEPKILCSLDEPSLQCRCAVEDVQCLASDALDGRCLGTRRESSLTRTSPFVNREPIERFYGRAHLGILDNSLL